MKKTVTKFKTVTRRKTRTIISGTNTHTHTVTCTATLTLNQHITTPRRTSTVKTTTIAGQLLSGFIFSDLTGDGTFGPSDPPLANVPVQLVGPSPVLGACVTSATASNGAVITACPTRTASVGRRNARAAAADCIVYATATTDNQGQYSFELGQGLLPPGITVSVCTKGCEPLVTVAVDGSGNVAQTSANIAVAVTTTSVGATLAASSQRMVS